MTEKRFIQSRHTCIDREKKRETTDWDTVINWLNKLAEETEQLKQQLSDLLYQIEYIGKNNKSCKNCQCFIEDIKYCWMWDMETDEDDIVVACDKRKLKDGDVE